MRWLRECTMDWKSRCLAKQDRGYVDNVKQVSDYNYAHVFSKEVIRLYISHEFCTKRQCLWNNNSSYKFKVGSDPYNYWAFNGRIQGKKSSASLYPIVVQEPWIGALQLHFERVLPWIGMWSLFLYKYLPFSFCFLLIFFSSSPFWVIKLIFV